MIVSGINGFKPAIKHYQKPINRVCTLMFLFRCEEFPLLHCKADTAKLRGALVITNEHRDICISLSLSAKEFVYNYYWSQDTWSRDQLMEQVFDLVTDQEPCVRQGARLPASCHHTPIQ